MGTGLSPNVAIPNVSLVNLKKFAEGLLAIATSCERTNYIIEGLSLTFPHKGEVKYYRFNMGTFIAQGWKEVKRRLRSNKIVWNDDDWEKVIDMADWQGMAKFGELTTEFMATEEQSTRAKECAEILKRLHESPSKK